MNLRFLLFSFLALSCSSIQPRSENAVGVVKSVFNKDEEKRGDLFLQDDGLWAYVGEEISNDVSEGTLLFYGTTEDSHSFAVIEANPWGFLLQRLDSEPLNSRQADDFIVSDMSLEDQQSWSICTTEKCLRTYRPGVVFHIYERDDAGRLVPQNQDVRFPRKGIARVSNDEVVVDGSLPKNFLAVASTSRDYPTKGRIANENCSFESDDPSTLLDQPFPKAHTPIDISKLAIEKSVDGFLRCKDGESSIAIPGLWRAHHPMVFGTFSIAPIVSSQIYNFPTPSKTGLKQLSKFMIAVGTGDFAAADFWLDEFVVSHPEKAYRPFLKNAAEISTAANRPENAIRLLNLATTGYWNPENDGRWNTVRYRIDKMVGTPRNAILRYSKLPEFFEKEEDPIIDFLTFFSLRQERKQNREIGKPGFIFDKEKWKLALEVDRNLEFVDAEKPETLTPDAIKILELFEKITQNPFDIFGRTPVETLDATTLLLRGKSQTLTMIELSTFPALSSNDVYSKQIYLFDSLSIEDKNELLSQLIAFGLTQKSCLAAATSDMYSQLELRLKPEESENVLLLWYVETGIANKCKGDIAFIASAKKASQDIGAIGPSILRGVLSREKIEYETALQVSEFAIGNARGQTCETFHTGLAFALFKRDNFIEALKHLSNASKCVDTPSDDLTTLLAFALYERTGEIEGDAKTQKKLTQTVGAIKNDCPGNLPLAYQFDYLVSPTMQAVSKKFSFDKTKRKTIKFEKTGNAVTDGRKAILAANNALISGDFPSMHLSLQDAQKSFETASFYPGLHRVHFLKTHLTQKSKKKGVDVKPTKLAKLILEKKMLEKNNTNIILMKILKGEDLKNLKHPDLCAPIVIPTKKLVIE